MASLKTDAFTGTDANALSTYDANWVLPYGTDLEIKTNGVAVAGANLRCTARYHGVTWPNDQYAQSTVIATCDGMWGVMVRHTTALAITYYGGGSIPVETGHSRYIIWKYSGGTFSTIAVHGSTTMTVNDIVKLQVSGNDLSLYVNSTLLLGPTTDASSPLTSGEAGLTAYHSVAHLKLMDDFEGGDLTSGATPLGMFGGN